VQASSSVHGHRTELISSGSLELSVNLRLKCNEGRLKFSHQVSRSHITASTKHPSFNSRSHRQSADQRSRGTSCCRIRPLICGQRCTQAEVCHKCAQGFRRSRTCWLSSIHYGLAARSSARPERQSLTSRYTVSSVIGSVT
jgi:hypothetical protein